MFPRFFYLLTASGLATACFQPISLAETTTIISENIKARPNAILNSQPSQGKIAIENVHVFDGSTVTTHTTTVIIDGHVISSNATGITQRIDAKGATLIPGLIDSHCHPTGVADLRNLTQYGVTTAFIMACFEPQMCTSLQTVHMAT